MCRCACNHARYVPSVVTEQSRCQAQTIVSRAVRKRSAGPVRANGQVPREGPLCPLPPSLTPTRVRRGSSIDENYWESVVLISLVLDSS